MRKKVRGLRGIERSVLDRRRDATSEVIKTLPVNSAGKGDAPRFVRGGVVLDYCAIVRGILNDDDSVSPHNGDCVVVGVDRLLAASGSSVQPSLTESRSSRVPQFAVARR